MIDSTATTGIRDPADAGRWLVLPWSAEAGFCEIVRHFLTSYTGPLLGTSDPTRQLAYFEGYHAALLAASTDDLRDKLAWRWREELLDCVTECVADYRAQAAGGHQATAAGHGCREHRRYEQWPAGSASRT